MQYFPAILSKPNQGLAPYENVRHAQIYTALLFKNIIMLNDIAHFLARVTNIIQSGISSKSINQTGCILKKIHLSRLPVADNKSKEATFVEYHEA